MILEIVHPLAMILKKSLIYTSKELNIYTLRISVNDINKFITQNPTEVAEASFTLKFYYDEDQVHEFITFQLDNCVLKEYSEGIGEKTSSEMNLTYVFVDSSRSAMTLTSPPSFSPI